MIHSEKEPVVTTAVSKTKHLRVTA